MNAPKGKADMRKFETQATAVARAFLGDNQTCPCKRWEQPETVLIDIVNEALASSRTATLKEILEVLPSDETIMKESYGYGHEGSKLFELGVNWLTKEIRAIIEKKLESV